MKKNILGQSFFELLVVIAIISVTLVALVSLSTGSVDNTDFAKNKNLATQHTQAAIEWLRGQRDTDWNLFNDKALPAGIEYCLKNMSYDLDSLETGTCDVILNTIFTRKVTLTATVEDTVEVLTVTSWGSGDDQHESSATTIFTNWN